MKKKNHTFEKKAKKLAAVLAAAGMAAAVTACSTAQTESTAAAVASSAAYADASSETKETQNIGTAEGDETTEKENASVGASADGTADGTAETSTGKEDSTAAANAEADSAMQKLLAGEARYDAEAFNAILNSSEQKTKLRWKLDTDTEKEPDESKPLLTSKVQTIDLEEQGYEALSEALDKEGAQAEQLIQQEAAENLASIKENQGISEISDMLPFALESTVQIKRADETVFSYTRAAYSQLGGAHPNTNFIGYHYDAKTGRALSLRDVTTDYDALYQYVLDTLKSYQQNNSYGENGGATPIFFEGYEETVHDMFYGNAAQQDGTADDAAGTETNTSGSTAPSVQWFFTNDALVVIFNAYDIAPYAAGASVVAVPFQTKGELIQEAYRTSTF